VNDVWSSQRFCRKNTADGDKFENPRIISSILAKNGWISLGDGTLETFAKLLVLDFFVASIYLQPVNYYEDLIYPQVSRRGKEKNFKSLLTMNPHLQVPLGLFEPRLSAKSKEAFKEIEDAEGILRSVNNLVDSIKCVIETLEPTNGPRTTPSSHEDFTKHKKQLLGLCSERGTNAQRALDALGRQLDYLTKRHAIREAKAIRILTILASLYLPLSLSASILGMQFPFKEIAHVKKPEADEDANRLTGTNLLFDFFGLFVTIAAITAFLIYLIRLAIYLHAKGATVLPKIISGPYSLVDYEKKWRFDGRAGTYLRWTRALVKWFIGSGIGITLLVVFLNGMLNDAQSAWTTAQWLFVAYGIGGAVLIALYIVSYVVVYRLEFGGGWVNIFRHYVVRSAR
jgi:hypothetical protein